MSAVARLALFAVLLAGVFGAAAFAGGQADLGDVEPEAAEEGHGMNDMTKTSAGDAHAAPDPVRGLAVSEDSLTLELATERAAAGERFELAFRIADSKGATVRDFDLEHAKRMHLIVVRRDLTGFQHVHPVQASDGSWSVPLTLDEPGVYRVFADFSTHETPQTLGADLSVDGVVRSRPLPPSVDSVHVDGLDVARTSTSATAGEEAEIAFEVTRTGQPVDVEPYLGAQGHLVALREGDLAFLHVHPDADRLRFMAHYPSAGRYRLFLQFKAGGSVHTAAFTQEVSR